MKFVRGFLILVVAAAIVLPLPWLRDRLPSFSSVVIGDRDLDDPCRINKGKDIITDYYPSQRLRYERNCRNGRSHGIVREYYPDGNVKLEETFVKGKRQGLRNEYYPDGVIRKSMSFKNGRMHGSLKQFSPQGQLLQETWWKNDQPTDELTREYKYYSRGSLQSEYLFQHPAGKEEARAVYREFFPNGQLIREYVSKSRGRVDSYREFDEQGTLVAEQKNGFNGVRKLFYPDGQLEKEEHYQKGDLVAATDYDPQGKVQVRLQDGKLTCYNLGGFIVAERDVRGWMPEFIAQEYGEMESRYGE